MTQTPAQRKRDISIGMLMELYVPSDSGYELASTDAEAIAANILKLAQLGRTERWQAACRRWAGMVTGNPDERQADPARIRHALIQGCVYISHANC